MANEKSEIGLMFIAHNEMPRKALPILYMYLAKEGFPYYVDVEGIHIYTGLDNRLNFQL